MSEREGGRGGREREGGRERGGEREGEREGASIQCDIIKFTMAFPVNFI